MTLWLIARASGFLLLATASLVISLGTWASAPGSAQHRVVAALVHRTAALLMLMLLGLHVTSVVMNGIDGVSWLGALAPFASSTKRLGVGLGTLGLWGFGIVAASGLYRGRLAQWPAAAAWWRTLHLTAWAVVVLALAHGLLAGTDSDQPWAIAGYALCILAMASTLIRRWLRQRGQTSAPVRADRRFVVGWKR
jgi:methionine sulfoxide reductase heme-binding subunit